MASDDNDNEKATTLALRAAFYAGVGSTEEEIDVQVVDYLVSMLIEDYLDDEDAWGALEGYLEEVKEKKVTSQTIGVLRQALKAITNAKAVEKEAAAVRWREEQRAAAEAAANSRKGEEEEEEGEEGEEEKAEEVLTEAQLLDLAFLYDLLGEGGVEEEEESNGKAAAASTKKSTSSSSSSSSFSSSTTVSFPRDLLKYVYLIKCGKTRQRAAEVLVTSASEEGIASLREEQECHLQSLANARATRLREALHLKQQIVDRFADQVTIHDGSSSSTIFSSLSSSSSSSFSSSARRAPIPIPTLPAAAESKLRFRDGVVVASKGEKYLIEKITPDWDGGSRGKIKTKGKRGPGFV